jgi:hypothetical protein
MKKIQRHEKSSAAAAGDGVDIGEQTFETFRDLRQ